VCVYMELVILVSVSEPKQGGSRGGGGMGRRESFF